MNQTTISILNAQQSAINAYFENLTKFSEKAAAASASQNIWDNYFKLYENAVELQFKIISRQTRWFKAFGMSI
jgi:capsid protein